MSGIASVIKGGNFFSVTPKVTIDPVSIANVYDNAGKEVVSKMVGQQAAGGGSSVPSFIVSEGGTVFPVPKGSTGPLGVESGKGFQFVGGSGGNGLSSKVADFRMMDPVTTGKFQYPGGYGSYLNKAGQTINPLTGKTISKTDFWWHIPAK